MFHVEHFGGEQPRIRGREPYPSGTIRPRSAGGRCSANL